uniref:Uncharacterized protein n=1 Tax=Cucumis melo TaxID=3656 RepID=A0A9I9EGX4_CUCME
MHENVFEACAFGSDPQGLKSFPGLKRKLPEDMQMDDIVSLSVPRTGAMELSPVTSDKKNENENEEESSELGSCSCVDEPSTSTIISSCDSESESSDPCSNPDSTSIGSPSLTHKLTTTTRPSPLSPPSISSSSSTSPPPTPPSFLRSSTGITNRQTGHQIAQSVPNSVTPTLGIASIEALDAGKGPDFSDKSRRRESRTCPSKTTTVRAAWSRTTIWLRLDPVVVRARPRRKGRSIERVRGGGGGEGEGEESESDMVV